VHESAVPFSISIACRVAAAALALAALVAVADAGQYSAADAPDVIRRRSDTEVDRPTTDTSVRNFEPLTLWVSKDIGRLRSRIARLAEAIRRPTPDLRAACAHAGKAAKHSHTAARWIQGPRASWPHAEPQVGPPRALGITRDDVETLECLVDEVSVLRLQADKRLDVDRQTATIEKLERIEALARQVEADLKRR
jgi:hypothetical protein